MKIENKPKVEQPKVAQPKQEQPKVEKLTVEQQELGKIYNMLLKMRLNQMGKCCIF